MIAILLETQIPTIPCCHVRVSCQQTGLNVTFLHSHPCESVCVWMCECVGERGTQANLSFQDTSLSTGSTHDRAGLTAEDPDRRPRVSVCVCLCADVKVSPVWRVLLCLLWRRV